jgi:hypothetical protein
MIMRIDAVYPWGLGWLQVCCSFVAANPRLSWNLRVTPDDQALIDRAVRTSGLTRTDFVFRLSTLTSFFVSSMLRPVPRIACDAP